MKKILFALALAVLGCGCLTDCSTKCCAAKAGPRAPVRPINDTSREVFL